jgi:tRNA(Ile)-lysidine synthase
MNPSAVANSGGPDSTCLLFLINRLLHEEKSNLRARNLPSELISLTVDHGLQKSSSSMAEQCSAFASSIGVPHRTLTIPWSKAPFPENPSSLRSLEGIARKARFHVLFEAMTEEKAKVIAYGHHADDQVETSLIRIGRGSTVLGAAGMRPVRRWGMGHGPSENSLEWAGHQGMSRWIIRPLLEFSKVSPCHSFMFPPPIESAG